jgi:DNA repair protein RadD
MQILRPYQNEALDQISAQWRKGIRRVMTHMATGSGKTVIFAEAIKRTVAKGGKAVMVVRGIQLVEQAHQRLLRENVEHGIKQGNHWYKNHKAPVQICSIDTLVRRQDFPEATLLVIDEAHLFTSEPCKKFMENYNSRGTHVLSVTATPYCRESLLHLGEVVVHPISMQGLIDQGYLLPARYFAPSAPDLSGVRLSKGDYQVDQLEERMRTLTGDIPAHWRKIAEDRPTVCFAVNIAHSNSIVAQFKAAGISAEHIEGDTPLKEREAAIERLRTGETKVISNVGVLCTGVDIPFLSCIVMARPTKSYNLFIQQAGRGTRPCSETGKQDFIILDHAGNTLRHGFITDEPEVFLEGVKPKEKVVRAQVCRECYAIFTGSECHVCGWKPAEDRKTRDSEIIIETGVLTELKSFSKGAEMSIFVRRHREICKRRGYKKTWVYHRVKEVYGEAAALALFPWMKSYDGTPRFLRGPYETCERNSDSSGQRSAQFL